MSTCSFVDVDLLIASSLNLSYTSERASGAGYM